jgi:hypothetical protein
MSDDASTQGKPRRGNTAEHDILAGTEFEHLPEMFAMRNDDGTIVQERDACYLIRSDCFLGIGREATLYPEDSIVVTGAVPNIHMEPLNRAAAINHVKMLNRLPELRAPIDIGDMAEAAQMLATDPDHVKLNKLEWQTAVVGLATKLKLKREGRDALELPPIGHNFVRGPRTQAPPLLGAKMADMSQMLPGQTRYATAVPAHSAGPTVRRATPAPMSAGR